MTLDRFTVSYIEALWSSMDEMDANYGISDLAPETLERKKADCATFQQQNWDDIQDDVARAGHDFWLTRNHHGAGFWDGDWPEDVDEKLTEASHSWGEVDLCVGSDGRIHS
jgi:hypothetical protein